MERVCREGDGLFPAPGEIKMSCSCPDWAGMCKHVAATLYGAGARLDAAPELLFTLRGVDRAELITTAGALLIWASFAPDVRLAAIALAIVTKTAFIALMLGSGVMKRQAWVALVVDTIMIVLFAAYLLATSGQAA
jgi:uncharacterized Zn finger protein